MRAKKDRGFHIRGRDSDFSECRILENALGVKTGTCGPERKPYAIYSGRKVFGADASSFLSFKGDSCEPFLFSHDGRKVYGARRRYGKGTAVILSATWNTSNYGQVSILEDICGSLGARPVVKCSCRHVAASLFSGAGRNAVFVFNPYTGTQRTRLNVYINGREKHLGTFDLRPLETKMIVTDENGVMI